MRQPLGQHFLRDMNVVQTILSAAELTDKSTALEIGPGKGVLTKALAPRVQKLVAVELDKALAQSLQRQFADQPQVEIVPNDFLKVQLDSLFPKDQRPVTILGNLPYSITSLIFEKVLAWSGWETGVFLIQREVADRIRSGPGSKEFGILSLAVQLFAEVEPILQVKPGAFIPPPRVMSTVIRLRRKPRPELDLSLVPAFFDLVHGAFAHRRKTLANSLAYHSDLPRPTVERWLTQQGVDAQRRAETLGLPEYVQLAESWTVFRRENGFDITPDNVYNTRRSTD